MTEIKKPCRAFNREEPFFYHVLIENLFPFDKLFNKSDLIIYKTLQEDKVSAHLVLSLANIAHCFLIAKPAKIAIYKHDALVKLYFRTRPRV